MGFHTSLENLFNSEGTVHLQLQWIYFWIEGVCSHYSHNIYRSGNVIGMKVSWIRIELSWDNGVLVFASIIIFTEIKVIMFFGFWSTGHEHLWKEGGGGMPTNI